MSPLAIVLVIAVVTVLATLLGIVSAAEVAAAYVARGRARRLAESGQHGAGGLETLVERPGRLAGALAVARALAYGASTAAAVIATSDQGLGETPWASVLVGAFAAVLLVFALGEALPRTLAVHNPERVALAAAPVAVRLTSLLHPAARALSAVWTWLAGLVATEPVHDVWVTADELRALAPADDEEASREEAEEAFIDAVADFTTKIVREVMVPRTDMVCVEDSAGVHDALALIESAGVSRLPVYHDTLDDIRGVLYAKDLLLCIGHDGCDTPDLAAIAREPFFVPETKPIEELLLEMRTKTHIAIVADEYGGTAGLVTIEDLLEEIVGEIFDEYDVAEELLVDLGDGRTRVDGRMPIDDLNEAFGTDIELEADSVGGLFVALAGHIPSPEEELEVEGLRLVVEEMEGNRVRALTVEPVTTVEEDTDD